MLLPFMTSPPTTFHSDMTYDAASHFRLHSVAVRLLQKRVGWLTGHNACSIAKGRERRYMTNVRSPGSNISTAGPFYTLLHVVRSIRRPADKDKIQQELSPSPGRICGMSYPFILDNSRYGQFKRALKIHLFDAACNKTDRPYCFM